MFLIGMTTVMAGLWKLSDLPVIFLLLDDLGIQKEIWFGGSVCYVLMLVFSLGKMTFLVEYKGVTKNYNVYFDEEPLSVKEMYETGFIAEIQLPEPDGTMLNADIVASPAAKDEPQALGRFYFEANQRKTDISIPATVKKFHFTKKSTLF